MPKKYWQIAAGTRDRDYWKRFVDFGMAFVGEPKHIETMKHVTAGDIVLLKRGNCEIMAAGEVVERDGRISGVGDKEWLLDVDGWELPAYCFVDWHVATAPIPTNGLAQSAMADVPQPEHRARVDSLLATSVSKSSEPASTRKINDDEILRSLIDGGLAGSAAKEFTTRIKRIRALAEYYCCNFPDWRDIREHESRTFLVIPLLLALGWTEQQLKIELGCSGGRIDVACFATPYRGRQDDKEGAVLIETKGFSSGLEYASEQAHKYVQHFPKTKVLVVSNGLCYKTFRRSGESDRFDTSVPSAYLNIRQPRDRYPLDPVRTEGALGVLTDLIPPAG